MLVVKFILWDITFSFGHRIFPSLFFFHSFCTPSFFSIRLIMYRNNDPTITNRHGLTMRMGSYVTVKWSRLASWEGVITAIDFNNRDIRVYYRDYNRRTHWHNVDAVEIVIVF